MATDANPDRDALVQRVKTSLQQAQEMAAGLRKTNTRLLVAGISSSAAATLVAGLTAAQGPVIGQGDAGWRLACIIAAVFSFVATVSTGLNQQMKINERLSEGTQCIGKLRALEVSITTDSRDWDEIVKEYRTIVETYPEYLN